MEGARGAAFYTLCIHIICMYALQHTATHCNTLQHSIWKVLEAQGRYVAAAAAYVDCVRAAVAAPVPNQVLQCVAVCFSALQRVAACCSVLQCVAV